MMGQSSLKIENTSINIFSLIYPVLPVADFTIRDCKTQVKSMKIAPPFGYTSANGQRLHENQPVAKHTPTSTIIGKLLAEAVWRRAVGASGGTNSWREVISAPLKHIMLYPRGGGTSG